MVKDFTVEEYDEIMSARAKIINQDLGLVIIETMDELRRELLTCPIDRPYKGTKW